MGEGGREEKRKKKRYYLIKQTLNPTITFGKELRLIITTIFNKYECLPIPNATLSIFHVLIHLYLVRTQ